MHLHFIYIINTQCQTPKTSSSYHILFILNTINLIEFKLYDFFPVRIIIIFNSNVDNNYNYIQELFINKR